MHEIFSKKKTMKLANLLVFISMIYFGKKSILKKVSVLEFAFKNSSDMDLLL